MKYKIILYVTEGCEACNIMKYNINYAINHIEDIIELNILPKECCRNKILKIERIEDFPTMIFSIDEKESFRLKGTYTAEDIQKRIFEAIK